MRILYICPDAFGGHGGIAQFNQDMLLALCESQKVREVLALPRHVPNPQDIPVLPTKLTFDVTASSGKLRYGVRLLVAAMRSGPFDAIICTHINLQPFAWLARTLTRAPILVVLHGIDAWTPPSNVITRLFASSSNRYAAVSQHTLNRFLTWAHVAPDQCEVLPCCIDLNRFTPGLSNPEIIARYNLEGKKPILSLGRLAGAERYKGFDEVLYVLKDIVAIEPDVVFIIAGKGDDRARLESEALRLGVAEYVRFTGYVPDKDKVDLYRAARVFTLAGKGEGFGIVLLEAMACGVPAIASSADGSYEAIRGGQLGTVIDPNDAVALKNAILASFKASIAVRPSGLDYFGFPSFAQRVDRLLDNFNNSRSLN